MSKDLKTILSVAGVVLVVLVISLLIWLFLLKDNDRKDVFPGSEECIDSYNVHSVGYEETDVNIDSFDKINVIYAKKEEVIGTVESESLRRNDLKELIKVLIVHGVIKTYVNSEMDSEICLVNEQESEEIYMAEYSGTHTYYTNSTNDVNFRFKIKIVKSTGEITVIPE